MLRESKYKHIIWDWNGTLLDDVEEGIFAMNNLLKKRKLPLIDVEAYKEVFAFPVKDYYAQVGLDFEKETFEELAAEFIMEYKQFSKYKLFDETEAVLEKIMKNGIKQSILSATEEKELIKIINDLGIIKYFSNIAGLNDFYANGKIERAKELIKENELKVEELLLIGDTEHDFEVAREIGCECLLVSSGHQSYERLKKNNANVVASISEVFEFIMK